MKKSTRIPTDEEYQCYDGMHCKNIWRRLHNTWKCPSCQRTKREIMLWGKRKGSNAAFYGEFGFKCGLHHHHDHGSDIYPHIERFKRTVICGSCNSLDGRLKKALKIKEGFSFSPKELQQIIKKVDPNTSISTKNIDFEKAKQLYKNKDISKSKKTSRIKISYIQREET